MNIAMNDISFKTRFLGLHVCRIQYRSIFNHFDVIDPKATEFGEIMQNKGHYAVQDHSRSFKVTAFGTNRKSICDFLLVINTNLHPISHRFRIIADYWSHFHFRQGSTHSFKVNP